MRRTREVVGLIVAVILTTACGCGGGGGGGGTDPGDGSNGSPAYAFQATGGTYSDGSAEYGFGLAMLATLRDAAGAGPSAPRSGKVNSEYKWQFDYDALGPSSYQAYWWPDYPIDLPSYTATLDPLQGETARIQASFGIADTLQTLPVPDVALSIDGTTLSWTAVPGALSYECHVYSGDPAGSPILVQSTLANGTSCTVGDLPAGMYHGSVLAFSADLGALGADAKQKPQLPAVFDVSERRIAFTRPEGGGQVLRAHVAGGNNPYSTSGNGLVVWISIEQADGSPTAVPWNVQVTSLHLSQAWNFVYEANTARKIVPNGRGDHAVAGMYYFTATSTLGELAGMFTVGSDTPIPRPTNVVVTPGVSGAASLTWTAVAGANSYCVDVYDAHSYPSTVCAAAPPIEFPQGTFGTGMYQFVVWATDADMISGAVPTQVTYAAADAVTYQ